MIVSKQIHTKLSIPEANKSTDGLGAEAGLYTVDGTFKSILSKSPINVSCDGITAG